MKEANPQTRVFDISHEGDFARAIVTRDGCLAIVSSFGNYAFWWPAPGSGDFRGFLISSGADYLNNNLLYKRHGHRASEREIAGFLKKMWPKLREAIVADLRECPEWTPRVAPPTPCVFDKAWIGRCGQPATERGMCAEHAPLKCHGCGEAATSSCDFDAQFVCGFPLCANCEHMPPRPDALFGMGGKHAPKADCVAAWRERRG